MPQLPRRSADMREVPVCIRMLDGCGEMPGCDRWYAGGCTGLAQLHAHAFVLSKMLLLECAVRASGNIEASEAVPWRGESNTLVTAVLSEPQEPMLAAVPASVTSDAIKLLDAHAATLRSVQAASAATPAPVDVEATEWWAGLDLALAGGPALLALGSLLAWCETTASFAKRASSGLLAAAGDDIDVELQAINLESASTYVGIAASLLGVAASLSPAPIRGSSASARGGRPFTHQVSWPVSENYAEQLVGAQGGRSSRLAGRFGRLGFGAP